MKNILQTEIENNQRTLLVGPPGCGKTARLIAIAKALGRKLIVLRASLSERVDFGGCLVPDMVAGVTKSLPLELLAYLQTTTDKVLLVLDDLGQAPIDTQAAIMRLFDDGFLSPSVLICGATNRPGDKAGVTALCEPLRSRFNSAYIIPTPNEQDLTDGGVMLGDWKTELAAWLEWAMDNNAPAEIIAWHRATNGRTLYAWKAHSNPAVRMPDFRSWGCLIGRLNAGMNSLPQVSAVVGKPVAAEFLAFCALASELPSPDEVWINPTGAKVPSEPSAQWLIATTLALQVTAATCPAFLQYVTRLPRVVTALAVKDAFRKLGAKLSGCREWVKWFNENQTLFTS